MIADSKIGDIALQVGKAGLVGAGAGAAGGLGAGVVNAATAAGKISRIDLRNLLVVNPFCHSDIMFKRLWEHFEETKIAENDTVKLKESVI